MKIWVDVSGLNGWKGNFTGIQRVNYNLVKELNHSKRSAGFFVYNNGNFIEVGFDKLQQKKDDDSGDNIYKKHDELSTRKIIAHTLVVLKRAAKNSALERPLKVLYNKARSFYRTLRKVPRHTLRTTLFEKDDVVVVVDGEWQFPGFAEALIASKKQTGFYLIHMVQDLIAYNNPALANKGANLIIGGYFKKIFKVADGLVAISESTKNDIEWFLKINHIAHRPKLSIITLGSNIDILDDPLPPSCGPI